MMSVAVSGGNKSKPSGRAVFPKKQKLRKAIEFKMVFKNPLVSSDAFFKVLARKNHAENSRLGMAVSRKVDRRAVGRNRIKRVIRESFRSRYSEDKARLDIVVLPRQLTATICNRRLFRSLQAHWSRLENQFEG
jgi:ribonuclease P protein component